MRVHELIAFLETQPADLVVIIEDADTGWELNVATARQHDGEVVALSGDYDDEYVRRDGTRRSL